MKSISASVIVFLIFIPFSFNLPCSKQSGCASKTMAINAPINPITIDCDECAGWGCFQNGIIYAGIGCKGDSNPCKNGENQEGNYYHSDTNCFYSCTTSSKCAIYNVSSCAFHFPATTAESDCDPNKAETNKSALKIVGTTFFIWILTQYW